MIVPLSASSSLSSSFLCKSNVSRILGTTTRRSSSTVLLSSLAASFEGVPIYDRQPYPSSFPNKINTNTTIYQRQQLLVSSLSLSSTVSGLSVPFSQRFLSHAKGRRNFRTSSSTNTNEREGLGRNSKEKGTRDDTTSTTTTPSSHPLDPALFTEPILIEMPPMENTVDGDEETPTSTHPVAHSFVETWYKKEGDIVRTADVLCDIQTPEFVFGMQIDDDEIGLLKTIHVQEGEKVPDRTTLCTIYHQKKPSDFLEGIKDEYTAHKEHLQEKYEEQKETMKVKYKEQKETMKEQYLRTTDTTPKK